jgi:hypothetical protein
METTQKFLFVVLFSFCIAACSSDNATLERLCKDGFMFEERFFPDTPAFNRVLGPASTMDEILPSLSMVRHARPLEVWLSEDIIRTNWMFLAGDAGDSITLAVERVPSEQDQLQIRVMFWLRTSDDWPPKKMDVTRVEYVYVRTSGGWIETARSAVSSTLEDPYQYREERMLQDGPQGR